MEYTVKVFVREIEYSGNFVDNDEVDLVSLAKKLGYTEIVETHIVSEREKQRYEDRKYEIIDYENGHCDVYWYDIEKYEEEETEEMRAYNAECDWANYMHDSRADRW